MKAPGGVSWFWGGIVILAIVTVVLGFTGWQQLFPTDDFLKIAYRTAQLVTGQNNEPADMSNLRIQLAGILAPLLFFASVVKLVFNFLASRIERWRISRAKGHSLICGCCELARSFAQNERAHASTVIVVSPAPTDADVSFCAAHGIRLLRGDPRDPGTLHAAAIERAARLVAISGDDADNLQITVKAREILDLCLPRDEPLRALAAIDDRNLWNELSRSDSVDRRSTNFRLGLFNLSDLVARRFFWDIPLYRFADLRGQRRIHAVFVGFGHAGEALLLQLLRTCTYRDLDNPAATVLCPDAAAEQSRLRMHCPEVDSVVNPRFLEHDACAHPLDEAMLADVEATSPVTAVLVCVDDDQAALQAGIYTRDVMHRTGRWRSPVYVRIRSDDGLEDLLASKGRARRFDEVFEVFGTDVENCDTEIVDGGLDQTARLIHEAYCETRNEQLAGDSTPARQESLQGWDNLRETYRVANRRAAGHIKAKLESAGCHIPRHVDLIAPAGFRLTRGRETAEALAELEHRSWCIGMHLDGWRTASKRNNRRREHDNLVAYDELGEKLKDYDREQIALIDGTLIKRRDILPGVAAIRHDHWIGLIGRNFVDAEDADWARRTLCEQVLPKLASRHEGAHFTLLTPLAPGLDLILTRAAVEWLADHRIANRLIVAEGVPDDAMLDDYRDAYRAGSAWDGETRLAGEHWLDTCTPQEGGRARVAATRAELLSSSALEWIVDLTEVDADYTEESARQQGYRRAGDYVAERSHTLVAALPHDAEVRPGGVMETIRRRGSALLSRHASWPAAETISTVLLQIDKRNVEVSEDQVAGGGEISS